MVFQISKENTFLMTKKTTAHNPWFQSFFKWQHKRKVKVWLVREASLWFKFLFVIVPHLLILCFLISFLLIEKPAFLILFIIQLSIYFISAIAMKYFYNYKFPKFIALVIFFVNMNAALLVGFFKYLSSSVNPAWERTSRWA